MTLKIKIRYDVDYSSGLIIQNYQMQYSSCLRFIYNRISDNPTISEKELRGLALNISHIDLVDAWFINCAIKEARQLYEKNKGKKYIFGGRYNFIKRCKGEITKAEYRRNRLQSLYSIGEACKNGNRKFKIESNLSNVLFKPNKYLHLRLELAKNSYKKILSLLYKKQNNKEIAITYRMSSTHLYIDFDDKELYANEPKIKTINDRVIGIDLHGNFISYSVVDWKSSGEFKVIHGRIYKFDYKNLRKESYYKNVNDIVRVSDAIIKVAIYYKCNILSIDERKNNKPLVFNLQRRCNELGINYMNIDSHKSFEIGNFLYRKNELPCTILSSIEIGRRGYEMYNQYVSKIFPKKKNIIRPNLKDFQQLYYESLEEFRLQPVFKDLVELCDYLKNNKIQYIVPLGQLGLKFSKFPSFKSYVSVSQENCWNKKKREV